MSMPIVIVQVSPAVHQHIVASRGQLMDEPTQVEGIDADDVFDELDARDVLTWVEDDAHPFHELVYGGDILVDDYSWNGMPLAYHSPAATLALLALLQDDTHRPRPLYEGHEDYGQWQYDDTLAFVQRAAQAGKGLIVGVA